MTAPPRKEHFGRNVFLLTAVSSLMALAAAGLYMRLAPPALARLNGSAGEVRMHEAQRLEEAGARQAAIDVYQSALPLSFAGEFNRVHVLKRLGSLLMLEERFEESLPYLYEAVRHPEGDIKGYDALCTSLYRLARWPETGAAAAEWLERARALNDTPREAQALFYLAKSEYGLGKREEAEAALRASAELHPGERSDAELARLLFELGRADEALEFATRFLESGGSGKRGAETRALVREIEAQKANSP